MHNSRGNLKKQGEARKEGGKISITPCDSNHSSHFLGNDSGFVLVVALVVLVLLTFLGIAALDTTTTETQISGYDRAYKQSFYQADTGISYAVQRGITFFLPVGVTTLTPILPTPVGLPAGVNLSYLDIATTAPGERLIEVSSTSTTAEGGQTVIVAGISGVMPGSQPGPGNQTNYP